MRNYSEYVKSPENLEKYRTWNRERMRKVRAKRKFIWKYWREYGSQWRLENPDYMRDYCRAWRERKARQAVAVGEFLDAFNKFEYIKRCKDLSRSDRL